MGKVKDKQSRKDLLEIPRGHGTCALVHNKVRPSDVWDVSSGVQILNQEEVVKGIGPLKKKYIKLTIKFPDYKWFCMTRKGATKTLLFPLNQKSTLDRVFRHDMDNSKPYYYDAVKPPPRKTYEHDSCMKKTSTKNLMKKTSMKKKTSVSWGKPLQQKMGGISKQVKKEDDDEEELRDEEIGPDDDEDDGEEVQDEDEESEDEP